MKRSYRLTEGNQFQRVRANGKSWAHPLLVLVAAPNGAEITRSGFSVGKRMGKAHVRNRIKRMIREAVRVRLAGIKPGYDLVWIARTALTDQTDFWEIDRTVENLLRRARLLDFVPAQTLNRVKKAESRRLKDETHLAPSEIEAAKRPAGAPKKKANGQTPIAKNKTNTKS